MITLLAFLSFYAMGYIPFNGNIALGLGLFDIVFIGLIMDGIKEAGDTIEIGEMREYYERRNG